jgi:hypothetical protein
MITRDNYQEFFLLYVDNELPAADRSIVEEWVAANPDLQEEWESLLSCRILPEEELVFQHKQSLLRTTAATGDIDENNYQDYFLSYIDGELNNKHRHMLESFIGLFPPKRLELEQLRQTVSTPDRTIVFPDKDSLYKNEKHRRVIVFYRLMAGAAAVLLVAVALLLLQRHPANQPPLARNTMVAPALTTAAGQTGSPPQINKKDRSPVTPATTATLYPKEEKEMVRGIAKKKTTRPLPVQPPFPVRAPRQRTDNTKPEQRQESNTGDLAVVVPEHDPESGTKPETQPTGTATLIRTTGSSAATQQPQIPKELSSFATQALLQEDNEKATANVPGPASSGKNKFRGLFRKVARTFGKTADRDGEGKREVLISAFQVAVD